MSFFFLLGKVLIYVLDTQDKTNVELFCFSHAQPLAGNEIVSVTVTWNAQMANITSSGVFSEPVLFSSCSSLQALKP